MKIIKLKIYNKFLDKEIVTFQFPWDKIKAMRGWYSDWWRDAKINIVNSTKTDKQFIRLHITIEESKIKLDGERMYWTFPSGTKLDAPFDLNQKDIKILGLHMEALKLALT